MEAITPAGLTATDSPINRWGDVDRNGDLVDQMGSGTWPAHPLVDELARSFRLASAITGATREEEAAQHERVLRLLRALVFDLLLLVLVPVVCRRRRRRWRP